MRRYRMYLGMHDRKGNHIDPSAVDTFFDENVSQRLEAYTLFPAKGFFAGQVEAALILEYIGDPMERVKFDTIGRLYAERFDQAEVLITSEYVATEDITRIKNEPTTLVQEVA